MPSCLKCRPLGYRRGTGTKVSDLHCAAEKPSGGFSLDDSSDTADVDLTAMTLQCLEPYATEEEISAIIDRGVEFLADAQAEDGGYEAYGDKSSESVSQVILALSTYGIDCNKDARFQKKEKGLYDNLMEYYKKMEAFPIY